MYNNLNSKIMKKLALILGAVMIWGTVAVNAQDKTGSNQTKHTTHTKSKNASSKKGNKNYHMNKKSSNQNKGMNHSTENNANVKSKGKPVY
jgi:hypothetical protein